MLLHSVIRQANKAIINRQLIINFLIKFSTY